MSTNEQEGVYVKEVEYGTMPTYGKASLVNRFLASIIDGIVAAVFIVPGYFLLMIVVLISVASGGKDIAMLTGMVVAFILFSVLYACALIYSLIKDGLWQGRSFGKKKLSLRVVRLETNRPCTKWRSFFRNGMASVLSLIGGIVGVVLALAMDIESPELINLVVYLTILPLSMADVICAFVRKDGRRIVDLIAGTQVINESEACKMEL